MRLVRKPSDLGQHCAVYPDRRCRHPQGFAERRQSAFEAGGASSVLSEPGAHLGHCPRWILPRTVEQSINAALQPDPDGIEDHGQNQHDDRRFRSSPAAAEHPIKKGDQTQIAGDHQCGQQEVERKSGRPPGGCPGAGSARSRS